MYLVKLQTMLTYNKARLGECMNKFELVLNGILVLVEVQPIQQTNKLWN